MKPLQCPKFVNLVPPGAIADNASFTSVVVDRAEFADATAVITLGATDIAMAALKVQESDDNSNWYDVSGADFSVNTSLDIGGTALALPAADDDNKVFAVHVPAAGHKRYLKLVATAGNGDNGTYLSALMILSGAEKMPATSAEAGCKQVVVV